MGFRDDNEALRARAKAAETRVEQDRCAEAAAPGPSRTRSDETAWAVDALERAAVALEHSQER